MNLVTHGQHLFNLFRLCTYFNLVRNLCDFTSFVAGFSAENYGKFVKK
jgi:hypothetical protein